MWSPPQRLYLEDWIMRAADRIVATCSDELFELVRLGPDPNRVDIGPGGVDVDMFRPDGPAEPRPPGLKRAPIVRRCVERQGMGHVSTASGRVPRTRRPT